MGELGLVACAWLVASGCQFRDGAAVGAAGDARPGDARTDARPDAAPDASTPVPLYAIDATSLYTIDIAAHSATVVGTLQFANHIATGSLDSIAYVRGRLVVISGDGAGQAVGEIDPQTAVVTLGPPLTNGHSYYGMTYDPDTDTVY